MKKIVFFLMIASLNEKNCLLTRINTLKKSNSLLNSNILQIEPKSGKFELKNLQNVIPIYSHIKIYRMNNL